MDLEGVIRKYDYLHATNKEESLLVDDISSLGQIKIVNLEEFRQYFTAVKEKICLKGYPERSSSAYYMAKNIITTLLKCITETIEKGGVHLEDCQKILLDVILAAIRTGPGSSNSDLVIEMTGFLHMDKYLEELRGDDLTRVIDALKELSHTSEEPEVTMNSQTRAWSNCMTRFVNKLVGEKNNQRAYEPDIHTAFLDLYMFYLLKMSDMPEDYSPCIDSVMDVILEVYKEGYKQKPYQKLENKNFIHKHLEILANLICSDKFGQHERQAKCATDCVGYILDTEQTCRIEENWDDICVFMKTVVLTEKSAKYPKLLGKFTYLIREIPEEKHKKNQDIIDKWIPLFSEILQKAPSAENLEPWAFNMAYYMKERCVLKKKSAVEWFPVVKGLLKWPHKESTKTALQILKEGKFKKIWTWKENYKEAGEMVRIIAEVILSKDDSQRKEKLSTDYGDCISVLLDQLTSVGVMNKIVDKVTELAISSLEKRSEELSEIARQFAGSLILQQNHGVIPEVIKRFAVMYTDEDYPWDNQGATSVGEDVISAVIEAYSSGTEIPDEVNESLIQIFRYSMEEDLEYMDMEYDRPTIYGTVLSGYLCTFVTKHTSCQTAPVCEPLIPGIIKLISSDEDTLQEAAYSTIPYVCTDAPALMAPYLTNLIEWYKETHNMYALTSLWKPYPLSSGMSQEEFDDFIQACQDDPLSHAGVLQTVVLGDIAEKQPELFNQTIIDVLMKKYVDDSMSQYRVLSVFSTVSASSPQLFGDNYIENVMRNPKIDAMCTSLIRNVGVNVAKNNKKMVGTFINEFITFSKKCVQSPEYRVMILDGICTIAAKQGLEFLKPHRQYFENVSKSGETTALQEMATNIINAMDGRSLLKVSEEVQQNKKDIKVIDTKVKDTAEVVGGIKKTVVKQEKQIKGVKKGLTNVNKRVDVVEVDLEETKVKVEEVDKKTMSNAPAWSRDLTKLMNPKSKHDWTLLAQRLGYTPSDIKGWATQNDPCMALLSEWYATHKTIEATHGVLTALQEMNRMDAAVIVENAMKAVEDIVEEAPEYTKPPPIFLSYQWGHQNEVKLLRNHLQMAGYECWMDVGQMGGGDKLFEKIDVGIRGAKVIICCVSEKYAKSPNCNREVNLSVNLGKPMIPLLMEKMDWPPKGSMGPIFSEYLFVRFFQRGGEETKDDRYWPVPKFQELLMQLNMYKALPDESLIAKEYKNWWIPVAEEIVINKKRKDGGQSSQGQMTQSSTKEEEKSPDVFLSYQWGKQKQIKMLYKRLTELGFTCWMDIYQMGGGDSLYDKIDRGVRGCKIVLSCVTAKYALSANCRREVSLADSLKKPLVPLLLEKIEWPPSGPMSMVFTQLLFINFYRDENIQMTWTGDKFDELLGKIVDNVPECISFLEGWGTPTKQTDPDTRGNRKQEAAKIHSPSEDFAVGKMTEVKRDSGGTVGSEQKSDVKVGDQHNTAKTDYPKSTNETNASKKHGPEKEDEKHTNKENQSSSMHGEKKETLSNKGVKKGETDDDVNRSPARETQGSTISDTPKSLVAEVPSSTVTQQTPRSTILKEPKVAEQPKQKSSSCVVL